MGVAIVLVALNLRPAVVGVGPLLAEIQLAEGLSGTAAGLLTALPVLCFGLIAPLAPRLAAAVGIERAVLAALVMLCAGILVRGAGPEVALFGGTVLVGAGIAIGNVLLPALVKRDFAHNIGAMTGLYTMAISAGGGIAAGITVPMAQAAGLEWAGALAAWGLCALLAVVVWLPRVRTSTRPAPTTGGGLWADALAWQVTAFMGVQSLTFYATAAWMPAVFVARGIDPVSAGLLLSLTTITSIVGSMAAPLLAARTSSHRGLAIALTSVSAFGLLIVLVLPGAEVVAMLVLGLGQGAGLGLAMTLMAVRAPDAQTAGRLAGMAQCGGYVFAAAGPFAVGAVHDMTGSWVVPLVLLIGAYAVQAGAGTLAGRDRFVRVDGAVSAKSVGAPR